MYSGALDNWSLELIEKARVGPSKVPLAALALAAPMAERTCSMVRPWAAMARGLTWIRTAGRCPPERETRPTPGICEIFCASRWSAMSWTWVMGRVCDVTARVITGASAGFTLA